ncbi:MAG: hypothetical protein COA65_08735 [Rhodospirillaceae bacterium]|nr:MAG: hypothetical protein COA65_08735 [Rhodospirillaceae bacterium]
MKSNADYKPILESLKTLKESGKVDIMWNENSMISEDDKPLVSFDKWRCKIVLHILKDDTLESLAEKVIKAEELMDELEMYLVYKQQNPDMYDFIYANLEL